MPQISIIVPVYKIKEVYLRECIDSLVNQTFKDIEIILIDDGSPDNCGQICDEYASLDERVVVIHQENKGVSAARNAGLRAVKGEWVTFVDADDWIELDMCEWIMQEVNGETDFDFLLFTGWIEYVNCQEKFVCSCTDAEEGSVRTVYSTVEDKIILEKISIYGIADAKQPVPCISVRSACGRAYRSGIFSENNISFIEGIFYSEDTILNLYILEMPLSVLFANVYLYHYRARRDSAVNKFKNFERVFRRELQELSSFITTYNRENDLLKAFYAYTINSMVFIIFRQYYSPYCKSTCFRRWKESNSLVESEPFNTALRYVDAKTIKQKIKLILLKLRCFGLLVVLKKIKKNSKLLYD